MKIPADNKWTQTNEGDVFGVLHGTKNITLDDYGKLKLSKKSAAFFSSENDADFSYPLAISYYNSKYIVLTDDELFSGNTTFTSGTAMTQVSGSPAIELGSDMIVWNDLLHVTTNTSLSTWNGSSWTARGGVSNTGSVPHKMEVFESLSTYQLCIGDTGADTTVKVYDTSYNFSAANTLTLPSYYWITSMRAVNGYLYVATKHIYGGEAKIFIWNGSGTSPQYEVSTGCSWVYSLFKYKKSVGAVLSSGLVAYLSGNELVPLAAFPVYYKPNTRWQGSSGLSQNGKVFDRGTCVVGDRVYINIEGELAEGYIPEMQSGLWVYDPRVGLYHRSGTAAVNYVHDQTLSLSNSTITTSTTHSLKDGDGVTFATVSGLVGVDADVVYYVKVISSTQIKLARSRKALQAGTYMTITGTPGTSDDLIYIPNYDTTDIHENATSGAVIPTVHNESFQNFFASEVMWGGRVRQRDATTTVYALNLFCPAYTVGSFETQRIYSPNVEQAWKHLHSFIDGLVVDSESVVIKYRTDSKEETPVMQGVWGTTNAIHSVTSTYDEDPWEDIEVGNEVVIVNGYGRGYSAHITQIDQSSNTYVLTLDETVGTAGQSVYFYVTNYKKAAAHDYTGKRKGYVSTPIDAPASWLQYKVELRGFEIAVAHSELSNAPYKRGV